MIDKHELARLLRVSTRTVRRMAAQGRLPKSVDYSPSLWVRTHIEAWIEKGCPSPASDGDVTEEARLVQLAE